MSDDDDPDDAGPTDGEIARTAAINAGVCLVLAAIAVFMAVAIKTSGEGSIWEGVFWLLSYAFAGVAVLYALRWAIRGGGR